MGTTREGTRFRIFPRVPSLLAFAEPEPVVIGVPPGSIAPGPEDATIRVINARGKVPYHDEKTQQLRAEPPLPDDHARFPPVAAGPDGHFDHLRPGTRPFRAAHVYAVVRFVLDVWEGYFEDPVACYWQGERNKDKLELIPHVRSRNAWSGPGFLEFGFAESGGRLPFAENFDIIAHEVGHLIAKDEIGNPRPYQKSMMFRAHEEAVADLVAIVAALTFDRVMNAVLRETRGNLLTVNLLSRFAEWGPAVSRRVRNEGRPPAGVLEAPAEEPELRRMMHGLTMATMDAMPAQDLDKHQLSQPFSAAAYEVLARLFEDKLVERRAIPRALAERAARPGIARAAARTPEFRQYFRPEEFREALGEARDDFGRLLARAWRRCRSSGPALGFGAAAAHMLAADRALYRGAHDAIIRRAFERRGIEIPGQA